MTFSKLGQAQTRRIEIQSQALLRLLLLLAEQLGRLNPKNAKPRRLRVVNHDLHAACLQKQVSTPS